MKPPRSGIPITATDPLVEQINASLDRYSDFGDGCPAVLREAIRYSLLSPGKRLRPRMMVYSAQACGQEIESVLPAACAVEMVHAYSLIHDDLPAMDDDDLRRGRPTCHKAFDEATAILAGDALLARAFEILARNVQPAETAVQCVATLGKAAGATALIGGQVDDLDSENGPHDLAVLESIHGRKTGALFLVSLRLGGLIAGASDAQLAALAEYGRHIGLAFQITDDLLDTSGDESAVGKRLRKDDSHGRMTFPALIGIEASRRRAAELIKHAQTALAPFGPAGEPLAAIAKRILDRTH